MTTIRFAGVPRLARGLALIGLTALALGATLAGAQDFPSRPIRMIVGFPPGGSNDIMARIVAPQMSNVLGVQVVIENKPGANATIGTDFVAKSVPDGHTILLASASPVVITPHAFDKIPYDTVRDFAGVGKIGVTPEAIAVNMALPVRDLRELVALSKTREISMASAGAGGIAHFSIEMFKRQSGGRIVHVPYKGAAPGAVDAIAGHVQGIINDLPGVITQIREGQLRGLAVMTEQRSEFVPDVPSVVEQGMPTLLASNWAGLFVPAATPRPIVERLHAALNQVVAIPSVQEQLRKNGVSPQTTATPAEFQKFVASEFAKWGAVAAEAGIRP